MINSPKLSQTTLPGPKTRAWGAMDRQYIPKDLKDLQKGFQTLSHALMPSIRALRLKALPSKGSLYPLLEVCNTHTKRI
jgi:hypothetical protein